MLPKPTKDSSNLVEEEPKQLQGETQCGSPNKLSVITENISSKPKLLAWCSSNNKISVAELETEKEFTKFDGVKLSKTGFGWTHVKEIANTGLLVSVDHSLSANLEVFDISRERKSNKIYSYEEVSGATGFGDVTYNPRRNFLGAMCVGGKIAYHLFNFDISKSGGFGKLIRKSKWHYEYHTTEHKYARCRWSTNPDEPLLFVKCDWTLLNILDVEKEALILKSPVDFESAIAYWIDVCQSDGNMLASCGCDNNVQIFDKRESKVVQTFDDIHTNYVYCVRWSPSGDMIASASRDKTVALLDFKTGKKLYTGKTSDGSKF